LEEHLIDCIFCKIVAGSIPASIVGETERSLAFRDVSPRQPLHILVVPKDHHANVADLSLNDPESLVDLMQLGSKLANELTTGHFRFTFNTGEFAGQTVFHAHGHITSNQPVTS
jgi:histidine triad (HIT) family protein